MNQYKLIIFDWDGTLYDSTGYIINNLKKAVIDLELPMFNDADYRAISGLLVSNIIDSLYSDFSEAIRATLKTRYQFHVLLDQKEVVLYPEAKMVLNALKSNAYLLAVATGKSAQGLKSDLVNVQWDNFFDITRTADKTASKPHPMMLEEILACTAISPQEALMVGDSFVDIQMAKALSMDSVGIHPILKQREFLIEQGAKQSIASLDELLVFCDKVK